MQIGQALMFSSPLTPMHPPLETGTASEASDEEEEIIEEIGDLLKSCTQVLPAHVQFLMKGPPRRGPQLMTSFSESFTAHVNLCPVQPLQHLSFAASPIHGVSVTPRPFPEISPDSDAEEFFDAMEIDRVTS